MLPCDGPTVCPPEGVAMDLAIIAGIMVRH